VKLPKDPSKFSFGATSSTVTSLGIIFGLASSGNPQASIIGSLLVIAVADNIADSLGIHIYRETTATKKENTRMFTISNFLTRFGITFTFVAAFAFLPLAWAATVCVVIGLGILVFLSYLIGVQRNTSTIKEILIHLGIAIPVIVISHFLGQLIFTIFG
jgi:VIT1/CCC1 family predicted Fe2+/Mn2+ transporter